MTKETEMEGNTYARLAAGLLCLSLFCGCQKSEDWREGADRGTWEMPVSFIVRSATASDLQSKGNNPAYANVRPLYTDRIQVNVYKRAKGGYDDDETGFVFDKKVVLPCAIPAGAYLYDQFPYAYASGVVNMEKGYEYRCTAFAYAEQRSERALFSFTESGTFTDAALSLTDAAQYTTPELFFGTPRYGADMTDKEAGDVVFSYESGAIDALGGWLYRCVAGVGLTLRKVPPEVKELALLTDSLNTQCRAACYDDFLTPGGKRTVPEGEESGRFVLDKWTRPDDWVSAYGVEAVTDSINVTMNESNLLPVTSTLYVRITEETDDGSEQVTVVPLRMKLKVDADGNPVSPDDGVNTAEQLASGTLVSRRNHYYLIAGDYLTLVTKQLPLVIRINPNWDGDIDLTPGGK